MCQNSRGGRPRNKRKNLLASLLFPWRWFLWASRIPNNLWTMAGASSKSSKSIMANTANSPLWRSKVLVQLGWGSNSVPNEMMLCACKRFTAKTRPNWALLHFHPKLDMSQMGGELGHRKLEDAIICPMTSYDWPMATAQKIQ